MLVMYGILQGIQLANSTVSRSNRRYPQSSFGQLAGHTCHRAQTGSVCHGAVLKEDEVTLLDSDDFAPISPSAMDAGYGELAAFNPVIEIGYCATVCL